MEDDRTLLEITKENNRMLRKLYRQARWQNVAKILYWILLAVLAFGTYHYIQPYINNIMTAYQSALGTFDSIKSIGK